MNVKVNFINVKEQPLKTKAERITNVYQNFNSQLISR